MASAPHKISWNLTSDSKDSHKSFVPETSKAFKSFLPYSKQLSYHGYIGRRGEGGAPQAPHILKTSVLETASLNRSELSSGLYCLVKWLSTDVSEVIPDDGGSTHLWNVGRQSFYTAV
jgi:hypothetical protein